MTQLPEGEGWGPDYEKLARDWIEVCEESHRYVDANVLRHLIRRKEKAEQARDQALQAVSEWEKWGMEARRILAPFASNPMSSWADVDAARAFLSRPTLSPARIELARCEKALAEAFVDSEPECFAKEVLGRQMGNRMAFVEDKDGRKGKAILALRSARKAVDEGKG